MSDELFFPKDPGAKKRKKRAKDADERAFRSRVWVRDGGRDRSTGIMLLQGHWDPRVRGEVCHLRGRRVMPEWKTEDSRALLLSAQNHVLSDARGNYRLKLFDPHTGEKASDASKPILFVMYDSKGEEMWTRVR